MKRVLIITYYWPPSGGSGVQRWLKMSKYLPENGWQPVIYTAKDAEYPVEDLTLEKDVCPEAEVIRRKIVEPYTIYKRFIGRKKDDKVKAGFINENGSLGGWKERLSLWIRGNLFIPDARCWWIRPSVRFLKKYLKRHPVDAIISTGPPHSMHLIAKRLHKHLGTPWIADFRDPWTEIDYYKDLHLCPCGDKRHRRLEHDVLTEANSVVTVSQDGARRLEKLGANDVHAIFNGFDWNHQETLHKETPHNKFRITYVGVLSKIQNPNNLWEAISEVAAENEAFREAFEINLIGQIDQSVAASIQKHRLTEKTTLTPYIPHEQVAQKQRSASLLLLLLMPDETPRAKGLLTGKLFEYLSSGRPILCIGPENGDAAKIIDEAQAGLTAGFDNKTAIKEHLSTLYKRHQDGVLKGAESQAIMKYERKELTRDYAVLLNTITSWEANPR